MSDFFAQLMQQHELDNQMSSTAIDSPAREEKTANNNDVMTDLQDILRSGLFDLDYYLHHYSDVAGGELAPHEHFYYRGYQEGRRPNPYFEPIWYLETNPDVNSQGVNPLVHYFRYGDLEGRRPGPLFDPGWYRTRHGLQPTDVALSHYLQNCRTGDVSPHPDFDAGFYARHNPDVVAAELDLFDHFINSGVYEGRAPSGDFDPKFYSHRYLRRSSDDNPFLHWLANRGQPGVFGALPTDEVTIPREVRRFTKPGPHYEDFQPLPTAMARHAKALAFYLPQFHAFPENDAWWGKGFTEWTNLSRGLPRFKGHYQPRVPRDLGHYSLETNEPLRRQAKMAAESGIYGFVFYYYWFNGKRLMEKPIEQFLADRTIDQPFCLMWANENWTRRWDGLESEVLISQDYRPADDEEMVTELVRHFRDPRYIRVAGGRPLMMIYRPRLIPNTAETLARWRELFRQNYDENPILVVSQSFGDTDPGEFGLDGAIEFPPHKVAAGLAPINQQLEILDPEFSAAVFGYDDVVSASLAEPYPAFPLIKGVMPGWDNDARRQGTGMVIHGSTPAKYEAWLAQLVEQAVDHPFFGERFICINAWNEWAEGAYLEPDLHYGAAFLNATGRAVTLCSRAAEWPWRLLLIGHDAHLHGAQELLLNIGRTLRRKFGIEIAYLLLDSGILEQKYAEIATVYVARTQAEQNTHFAELRERGFTAAIVNTTAAARVVSSARSHGISCINLIHELPRFIEERNLAAAVTEALLYARAVVFPAPFVRDSVLSICDLTRCRATIVVQPQGVYKPVTWSGHLRTSVRAKLGIANGEQLFLGIGHADLRKGFDLFLQLWRTLQTKTGRRIHCCWLGSVDPSLQQWLRPEIEQGMRSGTLHMPGFVDEVGAYIAASTAVVITSREDPFPSVALEALSAGVPVIAFADSGGIPDVLRDYGVGVVVPYCDVPSMAQVLKRLPDEQSDQDRRKRQDLMSNGFDWSSYVQRLLEYAMPNLVSVSVAVPNYNYARYMPSRLGSIFAQSYPVHEVMVLDDCSTDDSIAAISAVADGWRRDIRLLQNKTNSGSVFAQWRKAVEQAKGEFIWIAEADDESDVEFLAAAIRYLREDPTIQFAFADSKSIDVDGRSLGSTYKDYYSAVEPGGLVSSEVFKADEFVRRFLSVRNLILNVSAVVWRRETLLRALNECASELQNYRMAGDWRIYLQALSKPTSQVAYEARPLNIHRRHANSVTHALHANEHVAEIMRIHDCARRLFNLPDSIRDKQKQYCVEVDAQLKGESQVRQKRNRLVSSTAKQRPKGSKNVRTAS